jgi:N-acetylglucosamine kinase-like BadF-type ATPase
MVGDGMKTGVFVGVDSGGTRTNVEILLIDERGDRRSASFEVAESLSGALAPSLIPSVLAKIFAPLEVRLDELVATGLSCYAWVSAAGFSPWTRDDFVAALDALPSSFSGVPIKAVGVANDAVSLLLGSRANGIVIAGTGSSILVRSSDGSVHQAGGREWVASDYGSGFWIGLQAIRQAYRDFEAGLDSVVLQRVRQAYGLRTEDDRGLIAKLRDLAVGDHNMKREIARLAASICSAAERGDVGAQNIVKGQAEELADVLAGSLRRSFQMSELAAGIRVVQCGSLLGNSFYRAAFEGQLELRLRSGIENRAVISWQGEGTGTAEAIQLAQDISGSAASDLLSLEIAYRPAIVTR